MKVGSGEKKSVITDETVQKVARLARLELDKDEQKIISGQMGKILAHFEQLSGISTTDEISGHPFDTENKFREDEVLPGLPADTLTELSAGKKDGYLQVPRTVD